MKTTAVVITTAIGAALISLTVVQLHSSRQLQAELTTLQTDNQQLQQSLNRQTELRSMLEAEIDRLRERLQSVDNAVVLSQTKERSSPSTHPTNDAVGDPQSKPLPRASYQALMHNLADPQVAEQMAQARVHRKYSPVLDSFDLDEHQRTQAEHIIVATTAERNVASIRAMMGEFDDYKLPNILNSRLYEQLLLQRLSSVLNPDQILQIKTLRQSAAERRLRETYSATTKKQATGLSEENRQLLVDTIVDEMSREEDDVLYPLNGGNDYDPVRSINRQIESLTKAGQRLEETLPAEQMEIVNRYLQQQIQQLNFTASLWKDQSTSRD